MFAIGFVLVLVGFFGLIATGRYGPASDVMAGSFLIGALLCLISLVMLLWRVMP